MSTSLTIVIPTDPARAPLPEHETPCCGAATSLNELTDNTPRGIRILGGHRAGPAGDLHAEAMSMTRLCQAPAARACSICCLISR